jgi:carbonic anhydrase/acetyltransferase-like protein (isoleucine patch superfamily)
VSSVILTYEGAAPRIDPTAFIAPGAVLVGDVIVGPEASIWYGCVLRGDVASITIGARANVQDGTIVHVSRKNGPTVIGEGAMIGHRAVIHACTLEPGAFVGMSATVMDKAVVEGGAMVAAGALITPRKRVPAGELWAGAPAKLLRALSDEEAAYIPDSVAHYVRLGQAHRRAAAH